MSEEEFSPQSMPYAAFARAPISARPTSVTVIAVLAIVFGSLGILMVLCGIPSLVINGAGSGGFSSGIHFSTPTTTTVVNGNTTTMTYNASSNRMSTAYMREPAFIAYSVVSMFARLVLAIIAIWAGAGLLKLKPAARVWIIRYAIADLIIGAAGLIFYILVIQPKIIVAMQSMMAQNANPNVPNMGPMMTMFMYVGDAFSTVILAWPLIVLYVMSRPRVKEVFGVSP